MENIYDQLIKITRSDVNSANRDFHQNELCSKMDEAKMCKKAKDTVELISNPQTKQSTINLIESRCP